MREPLQNLCTRGIIPNQFANGIIYFRAGWRVKLGLVQDLREGVEQEPRTYTICQLTEKLAHEH
jgi:hypothetical protein